MNLNRNLYDEDVYITRANDQQYLWTEGEKKILYNDCFTREGRLQFT